MFLNIQPFFRLTSSAFLDASSGLHHICNGIFFVNKLCKNDASHTVLDSFLADMWLHCYCTEAGVTKLCFISSNVSTEQLSKLKYCNTTWRTIFSRGSSAMRTKKVFILLFLLSFLFRMKENIVLKYNGRRLLAISSGKYVWLFLVGDKTWHGRTFIYLSIQYYTFTLNN